MAQQLPETEAWLSLKAASKKLNVHPTTLRRWADNGDIPVMLTPGGHRRHLLVRSGLQHAVFSTGHGNSDSVDYRPRTHACAGLPPKALVPLSLPTGQTRRISIQMFDFGVARQSKYMQQRLLGKQLLCRERAAGRLSCF